MLQAVSLLVLGLSFSVACSSSDDPSSGTGGAPAATGGATSTGGAPVTGGIAATGGTVATTGGVTATGGSVATGGASIGGAPAGGAGGAAAGMTGAGPTDTSKESIAAFLASKGYQSWKFDAAAPRESIGLPTHGRVRVAINPALEASIAAGADGEKAPFAAGSMAVKELYGGDDALTGVAFMAKIAPENATASWVYYCDGPAAQCGLGSEPVPYYAAGSTLGACSFCHGHYFYIGAR